MDVRALAIGLTSHSLLLAAAGTAAQPAGQGYRGLHERCGVRTRALNIGRGVGNATYSLVCEPRAAHTALEYNLGYTKAWNRRGGAYENMQNYSEALFSMFCAPYLRSPQLVC